MLHNNAGVQVSMSCDYERFPWYMGCNSIFGFQLCIARFRKVPVRSSVKKVHGLGMTVLIVHSLPSYIPYIANRSRWKSFTVFMDRLVT